MASRSRVGNTFWEEEKDNKGIKLMASMGWQHGQGLGKHEQGAATHLRVKVKNNNEGIGATAATADDMFRDSQNMFNSILQRLNKSANGDAEPKDEVPSYSGESTSTSFKRYSARTEMYRKFKKGKDIGSYSATAMQEIMGKSASITYAPTYPAASAPAPVVKSEAEKSDLVTVKSKQSIQDYFKAKMAAAAAQPTSRFQVAGGQGFSEDFQADYAENLKANSYSGRIGLGFGGHSSEPMHFTAPVGLGFSSASSAKPSAQSTRTVFDEDKSNDTMPSLEADNSEKVSKEERKRLRKEAKAAAEQQDEAEAATEEPAEESKADRKERKRLQRQKEAEELAAAEAAEAEAAAEAAAAAAAKAERKALKAQRREEEEAARLAEEKAAAKAEKKKRKHSDE